MYSYLEESLLENQILDVAMAEEYLPPQKSVESWHCAPFHRDVLEPSEQVRRERFRTKLFDELTVVDQSRYLEGRDDHLVAASGGGISGLLWTWQPRPPPPPLVCTVVVRPLLDPNVFGLARLDARWRFQFHRIDHGFEERGIIVIIGTVLGRDHGEFNGNLRLLFIANNITLIPGIIPQYFYCAKTAAVGSSREGAPTQRYRRSTTTAVPPTHPSSL